MNREPASSAQSGAGVAIRASVKDRKAAALRSHQFCRSFSGEKPMRIVATMWNPDRYQGKWGKALQKHLRLLASGEIE